MPAKIDLTGKRFGKLSVLYQDGLTKSKKALWKCKCDCGNTVSVVSASLRNGLTKSCGCYKNEVSKKDRKRRNLIGKRFGRLLVTQKADYDKYICICNCGNSTTVFAQNLLKGITKSCGCINKERSLISTYVGKTIGRLSIIGVDGNKLRALCSCGNYTTLSSQAFLSGNVKSCGCLQEEKRSHNKYLGQKFNLLTVIGKGKTKYNDGAYKVKCLCDCGNITYVAPRDLRTGTTKSCGKKISSQEKEVADFVESLGFSIKRNIRTLFAGSRKEADIFIPAKNLIIEYDGNVWHSKRFATDPFNVLNKTRLAEENGYECMHIRSDQWNKQKDLVKSLIKSRLGMFEHRIGARQTVKRNIGEASYKKLADENHLQGYRPAKYRKGLFYKDILVACISYDDAGELIRYVVKNGWQIQGALPKLIKGENITYSFCDLTFFSGKSYPKAGFKLDYITKPNYRYINGTYTVSRNSMMKHKLEKQLDTFDPALTEEENCANNGWYKLYDCGNAKFVLA